MILFKQKKDKDILLQQIYYKVRKDNIYMWKRYIKYRKSMILFFLIVSLFLPFIQWLFIQPIEPILYAVEVLGIGYILFTIIDYIKFIEKHSYLSKCVNEKKHSFEILQLPEANNQIEEDYEKIIRSMYEKKKQMEEEFYSVYERQEQYYTTWVHQIKTPISAILLLLKELEMKGVSVTDLQVEMLKIEQYIDMVLQYIRMEEKTTDLVLYRINIDKVVKQAVKKFAVLFFQKRLELHIGEITMKAISDEKWLSFVIEQIVSNGVKYTNKGKISIYQEGEHTLVIQDTGIGIPKEDIKRIFHKGYTGWNGREYKKASGIGLFLCKGILNKLGHNIEIESELGKGTKVKIIFLEEKWRMF